jgi:tetratricopeptide (TPR) repeat protein
LYYNTKDAATHIPVLEAKKAAHPRFPGFARLASYYLKEGKTQRAVELCLEGLKQFPNYATAHFVLGKCYESIGRNVEAMLEYRRALKSVPDNPTLRTLLESVERREQEAFHKFAEERARKLKESKDTLTVEKYIAEDVPESESTVDFLLKRLQQVKKEIPTPVVERQGSAEHPKEATGSGTQSKIVTATLAEIYATQGEYREAIEAYKKLLNQKPLEAERYTKRIQELEQLARQQQLEAKT